MESVLYKHWCIRMLFVFCIILFTATVAFAEPGDGDGSGDGENKDIPIAITSSNITNGQTNVSTNMKMDLVFNKNVVNMKVASNNKSCFSLTDGKGNTVPITIQMADDQVDPALKKNISIISNVPLSEGTKYTLSVSSNFKAKNGVNLASPIKISFTTVGTAAMPEVSAEKPVNVLPEQSVNPAVNQPIDENINPENLESGAVENPEILNSQTDAMGLAQDLTDETEEINKSVDQDKDLTSKNDKEIGEKEKKDETNVNLKFFVLILLVIIIAAVITLLYIKRKKTNEK